MRSPIIAPMNFGSAANKSQPLKRRFFSTGAKRDPEQQLTADNT